MSVVSVVICEKKKDRSKGKRQDLQDGTATCYMETVPLTKRQKGQAGGGRAEESKIGSDHDGQD